MRTALCGKGLGTSLRRSTPFRAAAALLCPLLVSALPACSDVEKAVSAITPDSPPKTKPETLADLEARYQDPIAASQLREKAFDMLGTFTKDADPQVRANALEAMAQTPQRLASYLGPALVDSNAGVRATAAMLIGKLKLADLAPATRPLLTDPEPFVKLGAIYALSRCGLEVDESPLAAMLLGDYPGRVKAQVALVLGELGEPSASGLLRDAARTISQKEFPAEARMCLVQISEALVKLGDASQLDRIRAALYPSRPEDLEITALAVQILGQLKDKGAMDELIYLTAYKDKQGNRMPAEIRLGAAAALARLGLDKGTFVADEYMANEIPAVRAQAAFVYGEIGLPKNLGKLDKLMSDPAGTVRVAAAGAVLKVKMPTGGPGTDAPEPAHGSFLRR
jgi:HEAT repeat protein